MDFKLKRSLRRASAIAALALTLGSLAGLDAQTGAAKSFIWKVQSGPRVMYLAGSVHALSADVYPLSPAFEQAFTASDTLVEEIDLGQSGLIALGPMLLSKAMYQDGRTFDKAVSKETHDLVEAQHFGAQCYVAKFPPAEYLRAIVQEAERVAHASTSGAFKLPCNLLLTAQHAVA